MAKIDSVNTLSLCLQTRYSKSVESVVAALVDDTVSLSRSTRQLETHVNHQQAQLQDTKEALLRYIVALHPSCRPVIVAHIYLW